jgi:hypothetical protein
MTPETCVSEASGIRQIPTKVRSPTSPFPSGDPCAQVHSFTVAELPNVIEGR